MNRLAILASVLVSAMLAVPGRVAEPTKEQEQAKEALQELNEFIGKWDGNGGPPITNPKPGEIWEETMDWSWKFNREGDSWIVFSTEGGKILPNGELRYLPEEEVYQLIVTDSDDNQRVFEGEFDRGRLELVYEDPDTSDKQRLILSTNNDGARLVYEYAVQTKGRGLFKRMYMVQHSKEGESLAANNKRECVVTGGLGTIAVSHNGKTYYVCCSGCAEAFREDPEGIIREYEANKR